MDSNGGRRAGSEGTADSLASGTEQDASHNGRNHQTTSPSMELRKRQSGNSLEQSLPRSSFSDIDESKVTKPTGNANEDVINRDASSIRSEEAQRSTTSTYASSANLPQTSLDDLERWPNPVRRSNSTDVRASQASLPSSVSSEELSSSSLQSRTHSQRDSLQDLNVSPADVRLPASSFSEVSLDSELDKTRHPQEPSSKPKKGTRGNAAKNRAQSSVPAPPASQVTADDFDAYLSNANRLATNFPSFENVAAHTTRHAWSSRIVLHDRIEGIDEEETQRKEPWPSDTYASAPNFEDFYRQIRKVPDNCKQRIIIVEDLSPSLIGLLGATFQIPPHVFQEHLEGSGYRVALDQPIKSKAWQTLSSAQGYASITWYRPVLPLIPMNAKLRARLLLNTSPSIRCIFEGCQRHNIRLGTTANIWRRNLELCAEPGTYHKGSNTEYPVGWEERATIFTTDINGCNFVILLLDPLPVARVIGETTEAPLEQINQQRVPVLARVLLPSKRLLEVQASLGPRPNPTSRTQTQQQAVRDWQRLHRPSDLESQHRPASPRFSHESEKRSASVKLQRPSSQPSSAVIMSRLTTKNLVKATNVSTNGSEIGQQEFSPAALRRRATKRNIVTEPSVDGGETHANTGRGHGPQEKTTGHMSDSRRAPARTQTRKREAIKETPVHGPFVPYNPVRARPSASAKIGHNFTALDVHAYIESLQVPSSTLDEFDYFLRMPTRGKDIAVNDPFRALLRVIHDDTDSLVDIIRATCQQIREGTMDEDLMQKRVSFWRSLTRQLNFSLAEVEQELRAFVNFTYDSDTAVLAADRRTEMPSERLARDTRSTLRNCIDLLDRSSSSLLSEMQIVDSRRSIAEAESVSKLTELAFVFIPLSFVASLFSMQIKELEGGTSAYIFVLVAIAFVLVAYAVRLSIRSSRIAKYKNNVLNQVRDESHIPYNQPIPTHTFIIWVSTILVGSLFKSMQSSFYVLAPVVLVGATIAAILSPIILLWLRDMSKGFTAVITALLVFLDMILVYPVVTNAAGALEFNPRKIIREITETYEYNKKLKEKNKRRKQKEAENPNAIDVESSDEDFDMVHKPRSRRSSQSS